MLPPGIVLHLREARAARGLTLAAVEQAAQAQGEVLGHCNKSSLQRYELGQVALDVVTLWRLATLYHTAPHLLVEYVGWPVPQPCTCPCHNQRED